MFNERFKLRIREQIENSLYRNPKKIESCMGKYLKIDGRPILNFSSNDYLGLASSNKIKGIIAKNFKKYGSTTSSSRLVCGDYTIVNDAEKYFAEYFGYDDAVFFPSGFQANIAILSSLFENTDHIVFDKHIHSSSVKGIRLSPAQFSSYNHNDVVHLEKKLGNDKPTAVVSESLFSMDGDILDILSLLKLKEEKKFYCIIDEAHSFGVLGDHGKGIASSVADIAIGTLGKAFAFFGAFVLLPSGVKEYLYNFSSPLIYTTAFPVAHSVSAKEILDIIKRCDQERNNLKELSLYAKKKLSSQGFIVTGDAHILSIEIGSEIKSQNMAKYLFDNNLHIFSARYPTVPLNKSILRLSLTALHSRKDIDLLTTNLALAMESYESIS